MATRPCPFFRNLLANRTRDSTLERRKRCQSRLGRGLAGACPQLLIRAPNTAHLITHDELIVVVPDLRNLAVANQKHEHLKRVDFSWRGLRSGGFRKQTFLVSSG